MARLSIDIPDDPAATARESGLDISRLAERAIVAALRGTATDLWLARVPSGWGEVTREAALVALDEAREEWRSDQPMRR